MKQIFITGGTGYMGRRLIALLLSKGCLVKALVRKDAIARLPAGCEYVVADAFDAISFSGAIPACSTFVQLLGVAHPSPKKKAQFSTIDLASAKASAEAAKAAGVAHFIYVSVAQMPARIMRDFQQCRAKGEDAIRSTGIPATFLRPWYVVGPGHYWPLLLLPIFKILEWIPSTSQKAKAFRLVRLRQMLKALVHAVENPPASGIAIIEVEQIRKMR